MYNAIQLRNGVNSNLLFFFCGGEWRNFTCRQIHIDSLRWVAEVGRAENKRLKANSKGEVLGWGEGSQPPSHHLGGLGSAVRSLIYHSLGHSSGSKHILSIEEPRKWLKLWGGKKILSPRYFYWGTIDSAAGIDAIATITQCSSSKTELTAAQNKSNKN